MSDTAVVESTEAQSPAQEEIEAATTDAPVVNVDELPEANKPKPAPKQPHLCACAYFEVGEETETDGQPDRTVFTTECSQTTQRVFAQGHDARLVSFLVQGQMDGYTVWQQRDGVLRTFPGAKEAAASISEALGAKAEKALANAQAKEDEKARRIAARDAARAAKAEEKAKAQLAKQEAKAKKAKPEDQPQPREVPVQVAPGSEEGDGTDGSGPTEPTELAEGEKVVTIKVGRNEIQATMSADGQTVSWRNSAGEYKERSTDTVRIIEA